MSTRVVGLRIPPQANENAIRQGSPVKTVAIAVDVKTQPPGETIVTRIPIRGGSTVSRDHMVSGDPIEQLERSTNPPARRPPAIWTDEKFGDLTHVARGVDIQKAHPEVQSGHRNILKREHDLAIIKASPVVELGSGLNGHAVYAAPRFKPNLPAGRSDLPLETTMRDRTSTWLEQTMPSDVVNRLSLQGKVAAAGVPLAAQPISKPDTVSVPIGHLTGVTFSQSVTDAKGTPTETPGQALGKIVFLLAALLVAFWVLGRASK
jgi:hypothetical protein